MKWSILELFDCLGRAFYKILEIFILSSSFLTIPAPLDVTSTAEISSYLVFFNGFKIWWVDGPPLFKWPNPLNVDPYEGDTPLREGITFLMPFIAVLTICPFPLGLRDV